MKAEDLKAFAASVPDDNPIFYDEEYARKCGHDGIVAHPLFVTQIRFFLLQEEDTAVGIGPQGPETRGKSLSIMTP